MFKKRIIFGGILLALGVLYWINPERVTFMPRCVFHWLTGWDCPACGTQRAFHQLLHLKIKAAFGYNPFLLLSMPYLVALVLCQWFNEKGRFNRLKAICHNRIVVYVYLVLLVVWWIVRNII